MTLGLPLVDINPLKGATLFQLILLILGYREKCRVKGNSMFPDIKDGDLLIYIPFKRNISKLKVGQILVANHPIEKDKLIIKRLTKKDANCVELIGDNLLQSTDSRHFGLIQYDKLIGIADSKISRSS